MLILTRRHIDVVQVLIEGCSYSKRRSTQASHALTKPNLHPFHSNLTVNGRRQRKKQEAGQLQKIKSETDKCRLSTSIDLHRDTHQTPTPRKRSTCHQGIRPSGSPVGIEPGSPPNEDLHHHDSCAMTIRNYRTTRAPAVSSNRAACSKCLRPNAACWMHCGRMGVRSEILPSMRLVGVDM